MIFPAIMPFPFHKNGNSARRDTDAMPQYLWCGMDFEHHEVWFHPAGDDYIRTRCVFDAMHDEDFINGFVPMDAARIALEYARAASMKADREIEALKAAEAD